MYIPKRVGEGVAISLLPSETRSLADLDFEELHKWCVSDVCLHKRSRLAGQGTWDVNRQHLRKFSKRTADMLIV